MWVLRKLSGPPQFRSVPQPRPTLCDLMDCLQLFHPAFLAPFSIPSSPLTPVIPSTYLLTGIPTSMFGVLQPVFHRGQNNLWEIHMETYHSSPQNHWLYLRKKIRTPNPTSGYHFSRFPRLSVPKPWAFPQFFKHTELFLTSAPPQESRAPLSHHLTGTPHLLLFPSSTYDFHLADSLVRTQHSSIAFNIISRGNFSGPQI